MSGCPFHPRCTLAQEACSTQLPALQAQPQAPNILRACHLSTQEVSKLRDPKVAAQLVMEATHVV
jgi:hypothetical protein